MKSRCVAFLLATTLCFSAAHAADNQLTAAEKAAGWQLLFDGKTFAGWRGYGLKGLPPNLKWEIKDGVLHAIPGAKYDQTNVPASLMAEFRRSEIITEKKFDDFEFSWDWRIGTSCNNGIKYFVTEERPNSPGPEYQMLDDIGHPVGKQGPINQSASFFMVLPPSADRTLHPPGEWNSSRVVVRGNHVEHWLNGKNVLSYEAGGPAVKAAIAKSKFKDEPGFGDKIAGHIMLTYHGDECWMRNLKIRELK